MASLFAARTRVFGKPRPAGTAVVKAQATPITQSARKSAGGYRRASRSARSISRALLLRLEGLALVVEVLALRDGDLHLGVGPLEVEPRRDERQALLPRDADQALELAPVHQELAVAFGFVVVAARRLVRGDVDVVEPQLAVPDGRVAVLELRLALAQRLDLGPREHDPALQAVAQVEPMRRLPVAGDVPGRGLAFLGLGHARIFTARRAGGRPGRAARRPVRPSPRPGRRAGSSRHCACRAAPCPVR